MTIGLGLDLGPAADKSRYSAHSDEHDYEQQNLFHQQMPAAEANTNHNHARKASIPAFPQYDSSTNTYQYRFKPLVVDKSNIDSDWHVQHPLNPKLPLQNQVVRDLGDFEQQRLFSETEKSGPTKGIVPIYASPNVDSLSSFPYKNSLTPTSLVSPRVISPIPSIESFNSPREQQQQNLLRSAEPWLANSGIWSSDSELSLPDGAIPSPGYSNSRASSNYSPCDSSRSITGSTGYAPIVVYKGGSAPQELTPAIRMPKRSDRDAAAGPKKTVKISASQPSFNSAGKSTTGSSGSIPPADTERVRVKSSKYSSSPSITNMSPNLNTHTSSFPASRHQSRNFTNSTVIHHPRPASPHELEAQHFPATKALLSDKEWDQIPHPILIGQPYNACPPVLARILLGACLIFPPLWLLLGTGLFDPVVGVVPLGIKQTALILALCSAMIVIACVIIGMVVGHA